MKSDPFFLTFSSLVASAPTQKSERLLFFWSRRLVLFPFHRLWQPAILELLSPPSPCLRRALLEAVPHSSKAAPTIPSACRLAEPSCPRTGSRPTARATAGAWHR